MNKIVMKNCSAKNVGGDGVRIAGNFDVEIDGLATENIGGHAINILEPETIYQKIGVPNNTSPELIVEVLNMLIKNKSSDELELVNRSRLGQSLRRLGVELTTVSANLVSIASNPNVQQIIQSLSRYF